MVGHSKWSKVKRIRGPLDVKRGAAFSKRVKEITVAARIGSGDLSGRPSLRRVVETACVANMPEENIRWATKRGTGELEGSSCEEVFYEGCAPGGVALATEAATDNKNRTAADLRLTFSKNHGRFAAGDSALCLFHKKRTGHRAPSADRRALHPRTDPRRWGAGSFYREHVLHRSHAAGPVLYHGSISRE